MCHEHAVRELDVELQTRGRILADVLLERRPLALPLVEIEPGLLLRSTDILVHAVIVPTVSRRQTRFAARVRGHVSGMPTAIIRDPRPGVPELPDPGPEPAPPPVPSPIPEPPPEPEPEPDPDRP